jgi:hypothetical protein
MSRSYEISTGLGDLWLRHGDLEWVPIERFTILLLSVG